MDAVFGLISLTGAPLSADCGAARDAFVSGESGQVAHWSNELAWLASATRASRLGGLDAKRIAMSPSGRYQVSMAGALHYRDELWSQLRPTVPHSAANPVDDAGLVAIAWERWGHDSVSHLEGEFCLAVMDAREQSLAIIQSRVEYTPLYFVASASHFAVSTSLQALTRLPGVGRTLDPAGLGRALARYQIQASDLRRTWLRGIDRLPNGCAKVRGRTADRDWEYWAPDPEAVTAYRAERDVHAEIRERLTAAVGERIDREPIAACWLSGGLDSSAIACLAARAVSSGHRIVGVSAVLRDGGVPPDEPDERGPVECVRRHTGLEVMLVTPKPDVSPWQVPDGFFDSRDIPTVSPRHYLYSALFEAASARGAGLVLDGAYGELGPSFAGPGHPFDRLRRGDWRGAGAAILRRSRRRASGGQPSSQASKTWSALEFAPWLNVAVRGDVLRESGLAAEMADAAGPRTWQLNPDPRSRIGFPPLWRKVSRAAIGERRWAVDVTTPFRDPRVWLYCAGLPSGLVSRGGYNRYLIRAAMAGILPPAIQWRTTKGAFSSDYYARMRRGLDWARALCADVTPAETAAQWIDMTWMRSTLAALSPDDFTHANIRLVFLLQATAVGIQYLRWFDALGRHTR